MWMNQPPGSKISASSPTKNFSHSSKKGGLSNALLFTGMNSKILLPFVCPSEKLPLGRPSDPYSIILSPDTLKILILHQWLIYKKLHLSTQMYNSELDELPLN